MLKRLIDGVQLYRGMADAFVEFLRREASRTKVRRIGSALYIVAVSYTHLTLPTTERV